MNTPVSIYRTYHINDFREELKKLNKPIADIDTSVETMLASTEGLILDGREFHSFAPVIVGTTNTAVLIFKRVKSEMTFTKADKALMVNTTPVNEPVKLPVEVKAPKKKKK